MFYRVLRSKDQKQDGCDEKSQGLAVCLKNTQAWKVLPFSIQCYLQVNVFKKVQGLSIYVLISFLFQLGKNFFLHH